MLASTPNRQSPLRVCPDPNNLPFSNERHDGFENKIATLVARDLHRPLEYFWLPQRRGFIRNSLSARRWTSSSVSRHNTDCCSQARAITDPPTCSSPAATVTCASILFDAPLLKGLTIGIRIGGDDNNPLAAQELASRHIVENVRGFMIYGD